MRAHISTVNQAAGARMHADAELQVYLAGLFKYA